MHDALGDLLSRAAVTDGLRRIDYRDPIGAYGPAAVRRLEPWLSDPRLAAFAVLTITVAASHGALREARAVLQRARVHASQPTHGDIDRALALLRGRVGRPTASVQDESMGSPERALAQLRVLIRDWRERGSPPQPAIAWRKPDWMAAFPDHRQALGRLPTLLDRSLVRHVAATAIEGPAEAEFAFLVVKAWGEGENGYGPSRALESLQQTDNPGRSLWSVAQTVRDGDALVGYERLGDGGDCRIFNLGPAFGTKFLYFCQPANKRPQALIHDKNVGAWLRTHAGFPKWRAAWAPQAYRIYLEQMHLWAEDLECQPDETELCMFRSTLGRTNQWSGN